MSGEQYDPEYQALRNFTTGPKRFLFCEQWTRYPGMTKRHGQFKTSNVGERLSAGFLVKGLVVAYQSPIIAVAVK